MFKTVAKVQIQIQILNKQDDKMSLFIKSFSKPESFFFNTFYHQYIIKFLNCIGQLYFLI